MEINPAEIDRFLTLLAEAPRRIENATHGLSQARLNLRTQERGTLVR